MGELDEKHLTPKPLDVEEAIDSPEQDDEDEDEGDDEAEASALVCGHSKNVLVYPYTVNDHLFVESEANHLITCSSC
jgi:hypothetical protein